MEDFNKGFAKMERKVYGFMFLISAVGVAGLVFFCWVVVRIMQYFGIV